ncbi:MAG: biotin/lipoyl-containing protein [Thermoanaerobaculia bacterium]|nr:biotin/lipoyl-containing protein [Thermoanaerobaculia bacterium]
MDLVILQDGGECSVSVERVRGGYRVEVDGRAYDVEHAHAGGLLHSIIVDGQQREVSVQPAGNGTYVVTSSGGEESLRVRDPLTHLAETESGGRSGGGGTVNAYMPGRVVAVLTAEGDTVEAGQGVLVLEAMKMENEITAEVSGVVAKLHVGEGQSVEGGDPLFEIAES